MVPGMRKALQPLVVKVRKSNFDYNHATSLDVRLIFLESTIAGLEQRIANLEK